MQRQVRRGPGGPRGDVLGRLAQHLYRFPVAALAGPDQVLGDLDRRAPFGTDDRCGLAVQGGAGGTGEVVVHRLPPQVVREGQDRVLVEQDAGGHGFLGGRYQRGRRLPDQQRRGVQAERPAEHRTRLQQPPGLRGQAAQPLVHRGQEAFRQVAADDGGDPVADQDLAGVLQRGQVLLQQERVTFAGGGEREHGRVRCRAENVGAQRLYRVVVQRTQPQLGCGVLADQPVDRVLGGRVGGYRTAGQHPPQR